MDVGALIRTTREQARISQRELAQRAGTSQAAVAKIESGKTSPTVRTVERLMKQMNTQVELAASSDYGIDRTLVAQALRVSPAIRLQRMTSAYNSIERMREAARRTMRPRQRHG